MRIWCRVSVDSATTARRPPGFMSRTGTARLLDAPWRLHTRIPSMAGRRFCDSSEMPLCSGADRREAAAQRTEKTDVAVIGSEGGRWIRQV
jgi:hypothetical protein